MGLAPDLEKPAFMRRSRSGVGGREVVQRRLNDQGVAGSLAPWVAGSTAAPATMAIRERPAMVAAFTPKGTETESRCPKSWSGR